MAKLTRPEQDIPAGKLALQAMAVEADKAGWRVRVSRAGLPAGLVGRVTVFLGFPDGEIPYSFEISGGPALRFGVPATHSEIAFDWPGRALRGGDGRVTREALIPPSIRVEMDLVQPCRASIELETLSPVQLAALDEKV